MPGLRAHPTTLIFLALHQDEAVGIVTCFIGFSTFAARPLVNIHDLHVAKDHRRHGIARLLLEAVETEARRLGCCKLTLEVQENNQTALALYASLGFVGGQYEPEAGAVLLREKKLWAPSRLPNGQSQDSPSARRAWRAGAWSG